MPPGSLCSAIAVSIVRSISRSRAASKVLLLCIVVQPEMMAASAAALSLRMLPLRNECANRERGRRSDDRVPRPRHMRAESNREHDRNPNSHGGQRGARSATLRAAEEEHAENRTIDE